MTLGLAYLEDFQALVETGNFSRAAATRGATHVLSFSLFPAWLRGWGSGQPLEALQLVSGSLQACGQLTL